MVLFQVSAVSRPFLLDPPDFFLYLGLLHGPFFSRQFGSASFPDPNSRTPGEQVLSMARLIALALVGSAYAACESGSCDADDTELMQAHETQASNHRFLSTYWGPLPLTSTHLSWAPPQNGFRCSFFHGFRLQPPQKCGGRGPHQKKSREPPVWAFAVVFLLEFSEPNHSPTSICLSILGCGCQKLANPKMGCPGKWKHQTCGPYPGGLILTHTRF